MKPQYQIIPQNVQLRRARVGKQATRFAGEKGTLFIKNLSVSFCHAVRRRVGPRTTNNEQPSWVGLPGKLRLWNEL